MCRTWVPFSVIAIAVVAHGKIFQPVELAQKLHAIRISDWDIPSLVCLAHNASQLDTSHVEILNMKTLRRNITFYGVFGVPELWLDDCKLHSSDLLNEDVEDDVKCVLSQLADRLSLFDRTDYLGALTPHIVDLNKCFDWWEHLPHYVISSNETFVNSEPCPTSAPTAKALTSDTHHSTSHKPHPPVTTTCKCDSSNGSLVVDFSLIFLNIVLVALCYILWVSFVQRRTVKSDSVQFI